MRYIWLLGTLGASSGLFCVGYLLWNHAPEPDQMDYILTFSPSSAMIRTQLAAAPTLSQSKRQKLFATSFTERFRKHEKKMAVLARFLEPQNGRSQIKLMCPARLEPWNMDRLALVAWREAKDCLGENCDIDIYETFIGAQPRKIGELRNSAAKTPVAQIRHIYGVESQPQPDDHIDPIIQMFRSARRQGTSFRTRSERAISF